MFTSKKTILGAIVIIWALIVCIPYLIPEKSGSSADDSNSNASLESKPPNQVETGNNAEKQEPVKDKPFETENKPSKKEEKKDKQNDTEEMHKKVVNKDTVQKVDDESIKDEEPRFRGAIKQGDSCVDTMEHVENQRVGMFKCHGLGRNQLWFLTVKGLLKNNQLCIQVPSQRDVGTFVLLQPCNKNEKNQVWEYEKESLILSGTGFCLDSGDAEGLSIQICVQKSAKQKWKISS